jgi:ABC-2 type transport system permease protein
MRTLGILTWTAIKMYVRNKQALFFTFFFPIFLMTVLGLINFDRASKVEIGLVVSSPPNPATAQFVQALKNATVFEIHEGIEPDEKKAITEDERAAVVIIPGNLMPGPGKVTILTNANQATGAATAVNILSGMLDKTALQISNAGSLFTVKTQEINSLHLRYIDFLIPGLMAMSIMQMSVFFTSFVFVTYKEKGILKRLIATPMLPSIFVLSNIIMRLIIALLQTAIFIILGLLIFDVTIIGSYWLLFLIALFGSIMFLGLGFTISGIASTVESVPAIANLIVFPMFFLGGIFFPIDSFPNWVQAIARILPLTFFSDALREVMTKGASISKISGDLWGMAAWAAILLILANLVFSFEEKRQ